MVKVVTRGPLRYRIKEGGYEQADPWEHPVYLGPHFLKTGEEEGTVARIPTPLDIARQERRQWEAEGRPAPIPSGAPIMTAGGRGRTTLGEAAAGIGLAAPTGMALGFPLAAGAAAVAPTIARVTPYALRVLRRAWPYLAGGAAGYAASEMGEIEPAGFPTGLPFGYADLPAEWVAYEWDTGTARFYRLIDGRIAVQNKLGVWKVYRPKKHIVLSSNPRINQVNKLFRTCDKFTKKLARSKYLKKQ